MKRNLALVYALVSLLFFFACSLGSGSRPSEQSEGEAENAFDSPDEAQRYFLDKRLPFGTTTLPVERYVAAIEQMQKLPVYSTATNTFATSSTQGNLGTWEELGPGNIGGRTRALLVYPVTPNNPSGPSIMIAGGVAGGIWKSTNEGQTWTPKAQTILAVLSINSLARGSDNVLYAGTGDIQPASSTLAPLGFGIYKSTDGGETWSLVNGTDNPIFQNVNDIVVSPSDPRVIYAATDNSVWQGVKKLNKEKYTWTQVITGLTVTKCYDLAIRTDRTPDYIFASFATGKIYCSTTGGAAGTWSQVYADSGASRISLAIAPINQNCIYALSSDGAGGATGGSLRKVLKSTSGGNSGSWQTTVLGPFNPNNLNTALLTNARVAMCYGSNGLVLNQGDYDNIIAVDPSDPTSNIVWAGGIDLFRSDDGGANWKLASYWWTYDSHYVHADQHAIVFHPGYNGTSNTTMFVGCDGGIFKTTNARGSLTTDVCSDSGSGINWVSLNHGYGVTQFYHGLPSPDGGTYFGGAQDNGTTVGSDSLGSDQWDGIRFPDGQYVGDDGGYVAISAAGDVRYAETKNGAIHKSINGGGFSYLGNLGINETLPFITTFVMDPSNSERLWLGGSAMWRTDDGAGSWSRAHSTVQLDDKSITAIAVAPGAGHNNIVFAGTSDGDIFRTSNGTAASAANVTWVKTNNLRNDQSRLSWIAFDPANINTVYAVYSNFTNSSAAQHIYKSTNGGAGWVGIDGTGIPDVPTHCIAVDPTNNQRLYVGTDVGVYVSVNGGTSWARENMGFANVITEVLAVGIRNGVYTLYAFTGGRGAWRVSLGTPSCSPPVAPSNLAATAASSSQIDLQWVDNSNNETGFRIERGTDGVSFSLVTTVAANQTTYSNTGRPPNTTYYYRVKAVGSSCGDSGFSNVANATTLPSGSPPAAPSNPSATAPSGSQINLSWQDNSNNEDLFRIERKQGAAGTYAEIAVVGANSTSYTDTMGIQPSTQYVYHIRACSNSFGCSAYSSEASVTTPATPPPPPNACVTVTPLSGSGTAGYLEGIGTGAKWNSPQAGVVARHPLTGDMTLFVADTDNNRIRLVYLEGASAGASDLIAGDGVAGYRGGDRTAKHVRYNAPVGIAAAIDANGRVTALIIADTNNHLIRKLLPPVDAVSQWRPMDVAGVPTEPGSDSQHFNSPQGVTVASDGSIYVADTNNNLIRKINSLGAVSTIINGASAGLAGSVGVMVVQSVLYISDYYSHSIWQATTSGANPTRIAGTGASGFQDGAGTVARFNKPSQLVWCNTANGEVLFIADRQNHRLRKLTLASSSVTTVAGTTSGYQEGNCNTARFNSLRGVAAIGDGIIYILDTNNHRIRKAL